MMTDKNRIYYLDVYKGVCILFVIITHLSWDDTLRRSLLFPFWIDMAVPVFMVITGYLSTMSLQKRCEKLKDRYNLIEIIGKLLRFIIPFLPVFVLQTIIRIVILHEDISLYTILKWFFSGGIGPGSYYFPVMLQVILIMPLIELLIRKYYMRGLFICFGVNLVFEVIKKIIDLDPAWYRLCALRYVFVLAYGSFLFFYYSRGKVVKAMFFWLLGVVGILYIAVFRYTNAVPLITNQWTDTSIFAVLYLVPIMLLIMRPNNIHFKVLELLGKASFNIFLVQMVYFWAIVGKVYRYVQSTVLQLLISIFVCCLGGIVYYKIEIPITKKISGVIRGAKQPTNKISEK